MKKLISFILALTMLACMSVTAFAADGTTVLTVEVPDNTPSYILHVPADTTLEYGNTDYKKLGDVYASDVKFTGSSYDLWCTAKYTDLINSEDKSDTIALGLYHLANVNGIDTYSLIDKADGESGPDQRVYDSNWGATGFELAAKVDDWSGATPGATYQATITYVVSMI